MCIALTLLLAYFWVHPFNLSAGVKSVATSTAWCCTVFLNKLLQTFDSSHRWPLLLTSISLVLSRSRSIDGAESSVKLSLFDAQLKLTYTFGLHKPFTVSVCRVGESFLVKGSCDDGVWLQHCKVKPGIKPDCIDQSWYLSETQLIIDAVWQWLVRWSIMSKALKLYVLPSNSSHVAWFNFLNCFEC